MITIGAHVSSSGSLDKCLDRAREIGAECVQIFAAAPQSWRPVSHTDEAMELLKQRTPETGVQPVFVHGIYLINLATADPAHLNKSVGSLKQGLAFCGKSGARGLIFHIGSHKGAGFASVETQIVQAITDVLADTPEETWLMLENSAGQGGTVGSSFAELGAIIQTVGNSRLKVCLDTCHMYAAGHDLKTPESVAAVMEAFDREVGADRLAAVHANDCKAGLGSGLDRHENIGAGHLGEDGFRAIMSHPVFQSVPFLLEVPGLEGKGPDKHNVETLRRLAEEAGAR